MLLENNPYPADVRVRNEAEGLARAGYDVEVIGPRGTDQPAREIVSGVRVTRYRLPVTSATAAGFALEYLVANAHLHARGIRRLLGGAEILHLHNPPDTLFGVGAVARVLGRGVVFDQHDLTPELFRVKFGDARLLRWLLLMERATFRVAGLVLVPNESQREVAATRGRMGSDRVAVVRNGPRQATVVDRYVGRPGMLDDPRLVFVGALEAQDGVDHLPDLMLALAERHGLPEARLTVVGDGSRRRAIEAAVGAAGVSDRVELTGAVEHARVPALIAASDICIDPAPPNELNHRSTMVKIAEYMAAGKPIVAHRLVETERTAGGAAIYSEGDDGHALAAEVARLARAPELRAKLGNEGRERVSSLTWEQSERALLRAYGSL
jgi:glycosyltransferase involved in cell wall biosynthesis